MTIKTPSTPASKTERTPASTPGGPRSKEEKIVVTVRLRPLSKKEQQAKDQMAWECIDNNTIVYKPQPQERHTQPASFTFGTNGIRSLFSYHFLYFFPKDCTNGIRSFVVADKVFGPTSLTEAVYEEGVKNVALSALMGINGNSKNYQFIFLFFFYHST